MKNHKTQYMAFMAMFLAIEIALVLTPLGYIQLGIISATTMHIPVIIAGALTGTITNTVLVLGGIYLFFGAQYAQVAGVAYQALLGVLFGVVTTNGIAEAILGAICCLVVCKAVAPATRKFKLADSSI